MAEAVMEQGVRAERQLAVILFAQLRNFEQIADMLDPEIVMSLVNEYLTLVRETAAQVGGETLGVQNDTVLVAFRGEPPMQTAQKAAQTALSLQVELTGLAERWKNDYGVQTATAMGLHLGEAVFGESGAEGEARLLGAFGDTVSIAEMLARRSRAGEFVLSDAVMAALSVSNLPLNAKPLPAVDMPRRPPVRIFGVLLDNRLDFT
jgi:class 3 adenylate cyclase